MTYEYEQAIMRAMSYLIDDHDVDALQRIQTAAWVAIREALAAMPYEDYLETDHWAWMRGRALVQADHRCQVCDSDQQLEVHHRTYKRRGTELDEDVTVLCAECHGTFHIERSLVVSR